MNVLHLKTAMEMLIKIGISVGIVLGVLVIFMLGFTILPQVVFNSPWMVSQQYPNELDEKDVELIQNLNQTESYVVFMDKFPDNVETVNTHPHGGNIELTAVNTEKNSMLTLRINYDVMSKRVNTNINCHLSSVTDYGGFHANGGAVPEFIKTTTCLD